MAPSKKHYRSYSAPDHEFKDCINHKPPNPYHLLYDYFKKFFCSDFLCFALQGMY